MQGFVDSGREVLNEAKVKWKEDTGVLAAVSMLCSCLYSPIREQIVFCR